MTRTFGPKPEPTELALNKLRAHQELGESIRELEALAASLGIQVIVTEHPIEDLDEEIVLEGGARSSVRNSRIVSVDYNLDLANKIRVGEGGAGALSRSSNCTRAWSCH